MRLVIGVSLLFVAIAPLATPLHGQSTARPVVARRAQAGTDKRSADGMTADHARMVATTRTAVDAANARAVAAWNAGNVPGFMRVYGDSAWLLPANMAVIKGKEGIAKFWQGGWDMGIRNLKLATLELDAHMGAAQEVGTYAFDIVGKDGAVAGHDQGKYIVLWKKNAAGEWQWARDIFNSDMPATAAK